RIETEIDAERQEVLADRRALRPNIAQGVYPFKGMRLTRADVEWLLATHDGSRGPIMWDDERQRSREGLDLRGADLREANRRGLPLARLRGGLAGATDEQCDEAAVHLERADLRMAHLEGAELREAHLERALLDNAHLEMATLSRAHLQHASCRAA